MTHTPRSFGGPYPISDLILDTSRLPPSFHSTTGLPLQTNNVINVPPKHVFITQICNYTYVVFHRQLSFAYGRVRRREPAKGQLHPQSLYAPEHYLVLPIHHLKIVVVLCSGTSPDNRWPNGP